GEALLSLASKAGLDHHGSRPSEGPGAWNTWGRDQPPAAPTAPAEFLSLVDWASKFHSKHGREPDADDDVHTCAAQQKTSTRNIDEKERTRRFCTAQ
ncbi:hypothetical protein CEP53_013426, partial [Fusarium sp. AF-6]